MASDIVITPNRGSTSVNAKIDFTGASTASSQIRLEVLPDNSLSFVGTTGSLFSIADSVTGSLMSVNDASGLPILEVFDTDKVVMGQYNQNTLVVNGTNVGIGTASPNSKLEIRGGTANQTYDATLYVTADNDNDWGITIDKNRSLATEYGLKISTGSAASYALAVYGGGSLSTRIAGNGDIYAPRMYDSTATAYYVDPGSTSNLNGLTVAGTITGSISGNAGTVNNGVYTTGSYADPGWITSLAKSKVGLGNVENTALSSWAGSSNIITLGTIGTGIWNGTTIAIANGGTGATTAANARTNLGLTSSATTSAATSNTYNTLVLRDGSGNFAAGTITANLSGMAATAEMISGNIAAGTSKNIVDVIVGDNDLFRITVGSTSSNAGYVEFSTYDDGTEPIRFVQSGIRTLTLLDSSGNTSIPGTLSIAGNTAIHAGNYTSYTIPYSGNGRTVSGWMISGVQNGTAGSPGFYLSHSSGYGMHINTYNTSGSIYAMELHSNTKQLFVVYNDGSIYMNGGNAAIHAGNYTSYVNNGTLTLNTSGNGISGSTSFTANQSGAGTFTVTSNATAANTASTIVFRDGSGNFAAGQITGTSFLKNSITVPGMFVQAGSTGAPSAIQNGDLWWNTETGKLKIWYSTSSAWVDATSVPDLANYFPVAGGNITGNVSIGGLLNTTGNITARNGQAHSLSMGQHPSYGTSWTGIWRTGSDYALITNSNNTLLNAPTGSIGFRVANSEYAYVNSSGITTNGSFIMSGGFTLSQTGGNGQTNNWIHLNGWHGLYSGNNGTYFYPNNSSTYGAWAINGSRNTYGGIYDAYSGVAWMHDSVGNGGLYRESNSRWYIYHSTANNCLGIGGSGTSSGYAMQVNGNAYVTGFLNIGVANGSAPFVVASSTQVTNLNSQYLNGYSSDTANTANAIVRRDGSGNFSAGVITAGSNAGISIGGNQASKGSFYQSSTLGTVLKMVSGSTYGFFVEGGLGQAVFSQSSLGTLSINGDGYSTYFGGPVTAQSTIGCTTLSASTEIRSSRYTDYSGNFLFRLATGTEVARSINLADSTSDPSQVVSNYGGTGITWGQNANPYYMIYMGRENYNGDYTKLTLAWHTGIKIGAASSYGGVRFYNNSPFTGTEIFSVGKGDNNVRVENTLYIGGNTAIHAGNYTSYVGNGTLTLNVSGTGLSGSTSFTANQSGNTTFTVTSNATSANTASAIVARDSNGDFQARNITTQDDYTNGWFRNNSNNTGLYNQSTYLHLSSTGANTSYLDISTVGSTNSGIRFYTGGHVNTLRGYIVANTSNELMLWNAGGSYSARFTSTQSEIYQDTYVPTLYANIMYRRGDTGYYLDPAATESGKMKYSFTVSGAGSSAGYGLALYPSYTNSNGSGTEPTYGVMFASTSTYSGHGAVASGDWATYFTMSNSDARGWIFRKTGSGNVASISGSGRMRVQSLGVNTDPSATAGEIRATDNITAYYSDERLKTKLGAIENPIEKVKSLSGFYFEANETAVALGYQKKREVGVSAQEVQAILPEIIAPAPIDDKYMTVRYEKLIPLLIEAIKAQQAQIEELQKLIKEKV